MLGIIYVKEYLLMWSRSNDMNNLGIRNKNVIGTCPRVTYTWRKLNTFSFYGVKILYMNYKDYAVCWIHLIFFISVFLYSLACAFSFYIFIRWNIITYWHWGRFRLLKKKNWLYVEEYWGNFAEYLELRGKYRGIFRMEIWGEFDFASNGNYLGLFFTYLHTNII